MHVFIDSNVFYNNWNLNNPNFQYLFNFLNNNHHTLLISKLVIEETENNRRKQVEKSKADLKKVIKDYKKLNDDPAGFDLTNVEYEDYDLFETVKKKTDNVVVFDYNSLTHKEIVQRTLSDRKPFLSGEKGYRDTLIWLSFLGYLLQNDISDDVIFISNNKDDFFKKKSSNISFHQDLLEDIINIEIKNEIIPFNSLYSFINSRVDKEYHEVNHDMLIEEAEEFVEIYGIENIEEETKLKVIYPSRGGLYQTTIKEILCIRANIVEGLEDPEIMHVSEIDSNEVRVGFSYNLRRVALEIEVSESNYLLNKAEFDQIFFEISTEKDVAIMNVIARPYFFSSFIYNTSDQDLKNFYVDEISIKI